MSVILAKFEQDLLTKIKKYNQQLYLKYKGHIKLDNCLSRQLVSFQANKQTPIYRWYKYKEAFSAQLVKYLLDKYSIETGSILDPFAGAGTAMFAASESGYDAYGVELLPIGQEIILTRKALESVDKTALVKKLIKWRDDKPWEYSKKGKEFNVLRITNGAYSSKTQKEIKQFLGVINNLKDSNLKQILFFSLLCIAESISYTRKDGQYLRWDARSKRTNGKGDFDKGYIPSFSKAMIDKLNEIIVDINQENYQPSLFSELIDVNKGKTFLYKGSCLVELPKIQSDNFSAIITSPPYCNRYDYTRTYALELALLGIDEYGLRDLRQAMLSCTVENKEKDLEQLNPKWKTILQVANDHLLLQSILKYLDDLRIKGELNNDGILRMVRGYFYEMACVIQESYRVLKKNGIMIMVNDNVKYAGMGIPVDLILSDIAEKIGFKILNILMLPQGKGNSSQQMGIHGREVLRKCVYVWRKN